MDFLTIQIISKKVGGNDVFFFISKITSKKYMEITSKFGLWHIDVISTSTRRELDVECPLGIYPINSNAII